MRTEFGVERSSCACDNCTTNCKFMPGFLIPADLKRLIPDGADPLVWAESNLLASPGALVMKNGKVFRIHTLVPAVKPDGSCIHLDAAGNCGIWAAAPFGCAFFSCKPEAPHLGNSGIIAVMVAWVDTDSLYRRIWAHLDRTKRTQHAPEVLRKRMMTAMIEQELCR